ncbi:hydroxymethylglutaryl-CoA reductase [Chenggangzhangella methanolivorans]|uniref:hydroxymethylglutaryl-CoA reductase (NADPH) n=1 Tax=Chenggangzhangella methanolivorans TaxID=1437009 RepID=A0A9E6RB79_9HYPH|nr:hydroxymethylglutaryl-CoA reductase [Chenggangzhangella methanolivorans]QZO01165.1 hydroxymethylglutaryl-CoA reductase [Chenggangzhangella methanolivorans]
MKIVPSSVQLLLERLRATYTAEEARLRLSRQAERAPERTLRSAREASSANISSLWRQLGAAGVEIAGVEQELADQRTLEQAERYSGNIEAMVGTVKLPVGVVGPLLVNGLNAKGLYYAPMATTEAALVASYARGAMVATRSGGVTTALLNEGVLRTPGFKFSGLIDAGLFVEWVARNADELKAAAEATTRHGKLIALEPIIDNDIVFLLCRYTTGDASGQNMVTIATDALCAKIEQDCPVKPLHWFIEANFSGDKKASYIGLITGRGRKVSASTVIPEALVEKHLHVSIDRMLAYGEMANLGALLSGQMGAQGHYANGLAAFYIATGQDAACVSESAVGFTRMERREDGLFVSVTLPNILVGSVGGGTGMPSQSAALSLLGLKGAGHGAALAEVTAALCLCGEISIMAAIAAGHFSSAHEKLARKR